MVKRMPILAPSVGKVNLVEWNGGVDYWSTTSTTLHNLSCMEVTVKLSLCLLWSHPMQVTKITITVLYTEAMY